MSYNPWGKKNPWLSMWMSGANAVMGASRNRMRAAATRSANTAMSEGTRQLFALWGMDTRSGSTRKRRQRK